MIKTGKIKNKRYWAYGDYNKENECCVIILTENENESAKLLQNLKEIDKVEYVPYGGGLE